MYQGIKKFSTSFSSFCGMLPEVFFLEVPVAIVTLYPGWHSTFSHLQCKKWKGEGS